MLPVSAVEIFLLSGSYLMALRSVSAPATSGWSVLPFPSVNGQLLSVGSSAVILFHHAVGKVVQ